MLDGGGGVDVAYMDFRKAFDSMSHCRLLKKLQAYGIKGKLLTWIGDFLTVRKQRVLVNGKESSWCNVSSSIPQGSVLDPVLFVVFINDLTDDIDSNVKICAEDTKLYRQVDKLSDHTAMQADLEALKNWSEKWRCVLMTRNAVMHLGSHPEGQPYQLGQKVMPAIECERDLGVLVDRELKFHQNNRDIGKSKPTSWANPSLFYDQKSKTDNATL